MNMCFHNVGAIPNRYTQTHSLLGSPVMCPAADMSTGSKHDEYNGEAPAPDREHAHKCNEIERDRTDLAYEEASKLCSSAALFNKTQSK